MTPNHAYPRLVIDRAFEHSLDRLTPDEQKQVKIHVFDLQRNPSDPGFQLHRIERARDKNFWSVRIGADLRLIVHKTPESLLVCYVDHHDKAYGWASRRSLKTHPQTGAVQWVEIPELVMPRPAKKVSAKAKTLLRCSEAELLSYGVPEEWLVPLLGETDQDRLLELAIHLPDEAGEAVLFLASGQQPAKSVTAPEKPPDGYDFGHADSRRRFRLIGSSQELSNALDFPWERWMVFLHPEQRQLVEKSFAGPVRVSGSAGTGKTIVALHRAAYLARTNPGSKILLASFSRILVNYLKVKIKLLLQDEPHLAEQIEVMTLDETALRLHRGHRDRYSLLDGAAGKEKTLDDILARAIRKVQTDQGQRPEFKLAFLRQEWSEVVDAWQIKSWETYRDVPRLGRKTRLAPAKREKLWAIFKEALNIMDSDGLMTMAGLYESLAGTMRQVKNPPFDFIVIDEAQDISVPQLRLIAALGAHQPGGIFFAGDMGQRIFQPPFSWKALGVDIRGRSYALRINYRTSHQIRRKADYLLNANITDPDFVSEKRREAVSIFSGPEPVVAKYADLPEEISLAGGWLKERLEDGLKPHEIALFVRSQSQLPRARTVALASGWPFVELDNQTSPQDGYLTLSTMHLAKGLEFKAVIILACDQGIIPCQARVESIADEADLDEVLETERHLLYVACTRARDYLLVSGLCPGSEFLDDLSDPLSARLPWT